MYVLIAGGSGLIGRALAANLSQGRHRVIILSRDPARVTGFPDGVMVTRWDGRSTMGWEALADGTDAIVNLAGESIGSGRWTESRKIRIRESRLNAGKAIVEAVRAASHKPRVVVQASGVGYYGQTGDNEVTEASPAGTDYLAKLAIDWEASTEPVEALGIRRVVIRTGVLLSRRGGVLPRMMLPFRLFVGGPLGSGRQWIPWIHISDEVAAIGFLIENEAARGPYNLAAPVPVRNADFARELGKALRRPSSVTTPALALRALFGEMSTVILDGQRAVPDRLLKAKFEFNYADLSSALDDLIRG